MKKSPLTTEGIVEFRQKHFLPTALFYHAEYPFQLLQGRGVHVFDEKGKKYLDAIGGIVCISAGHNHPRIKKALIAMLENDEIQHTSLIYLNPHVVELSRLLLQEAPENLDHCAFTNSGSEANELAFMAARTFTKETVIMSLRHGYHGGTAATLAACGQSRWKFPSQAPSAVTWAAEPNCYRCPFGKTPKSCHLECAKNVETTLQTTTAGKVAAFIAEPVMGVGGIITPPDEYFHEVARIIHEHGGLYISDEVQTGAGRCGGRFLLTTELGIKADIVTMAKGLGNGAPVGAVLLKEDISQSLSGKLHFNTFGGDPYPMVQAKITMEILRDENLIPQARTLGRKLKDGLCDLMKTHPLIGDVRGRGLLLGMELVKDRKSKEYAPEETLKLMNLCKEKGLLIGRGGLHGNVIRLAPPLCLQEREVEEMLKILDESLRELSRS